MHSRPGLGDVDGGLKAVSLRAFYRSPPKLFPRRSTITRLSSCPTLSVRSIPYVRKQKYRP